ncbi:MAG: aminopeptidase P family protein [Bacteroidales bacterium]|nr:aminopeptidase P family protein [Bacteroidales bacterium]
MQRIGNLQAVREKLQQIGASAIIIPTNDPHFGEYTQAHYKVREWLSGFDGSAGTLVVTLKGAALWTDSRYFVQAAAQLNGSGIRLMKMKMAGTPSIAEWILSQYPEGEVVAIDHALFSYSEYESLSRELAPCRVVLIDDPFDELWQGRPQLQFNPIIWLDKKYTGESSRSKHERITRALGLGGERFAYIVTMCDEVAWLCNIRGTDIEYNPLPQSYAIITNSAIHLFANLDSIPDDVKGHLLDDKIELHPYSSFSSVLAEFPASTVRVVSKSRITVRDYMALDTPGVRFFGDPVNGGIVNYYKSIKNNWEKEGFCKAFLADGVAWCKVLKYIDDSLAAGAELSEWEIGMKFAQLRGENEFYRGESFEPIVAFGPAGALPHYSASKDNSQIVGKNNFLLMDTGAHYLFGTTDTTRTIPVGELTPAQRRHYTLVLKGMIRLSMACFPKNTRGSQLDILARGPLFNDAAMYFHGTGHGIGHYLCVHEGPQSIRMEENPVTLEPGMVISNEPAVYMEGEYGIRTENVILVQEWKFNDMNDFYNFKTLTNVPVDLSCVDWELLDGEESAWIKEYNANVYKTLAPLLSEEEAQWMLKKYLG